MSQWDLGRGKSYSPTETFKSYSGTSSSSRHSVSCDHIQNCKVPLGIYFWCNIFHKSFTIRYDYPREWPELLPSLLHLVRTEDDLVQQRALLYLHHVTKSLASKRLAGDRRAFQDLSSEMYSYVFALYNHLSQTLSQQVCHTKYTTKPRMSAWRCVDTCSTLLRLLLFHSVFYTKKKKKKKKIHLMTTSSVNLSTLITVTAQVEKFFLVKGKFLWV